MLAIVDSDCRVQPVFKVRVQRSGLGSVKKVAGTRLQYLCGVVISCQIE